MLSGVFARKSLERGVKELPLVRNDAHGNDWHSWAALESAPLFTGVSPEDLKRISAAARLKRFARGEMPFLEGDKVEQLLLLISGTVKITQLGPKGMEVILRLGVPGDVFDVVSLFATGRHGTTVQAIRSCGAFVWDAGVFKALVEGLPVLYQNMNRFICGHLRELEERFRELATERVAPRVARQLIRLQKQIGSPREGEVEICLSREGLAQMIGTTLYTVSRLLSAWDAHGLVTCRRESVLISDAPALRRVFEEN
jgi:CRP/FNR family transcriptional regulator, nitrogen oxide reductase regulator